MKNASGNASYFVTLFFVGSEQVDADYYTTRNDRRVHEFVCFRSMQVLISL